jgi:hypothetical protein
MGMRAWAMGGKRIRREPRRGGREGTQYKALSLVKVKGHPHPDVTDPGQKKANKNQWAKRSTQGLKCRDVSLGHGSEGQKTYFRRFPK